MNNFIEKIIALLSATALSAVYSPTLKEQQQNIAAVQMLPSSPGGGANTVNTLSNKFAYANIPFAVLIKGDDDDGNTLGLANEVFTKLHNLLEEAFTGGTIINIEGSTPSFVTVTEKEDIIYNVNFLAIVQFN